MHVASSRARRWGADLRIARLVAWFFKSLDDDDGLDDADDINQKNVTAKQKKRDAAAAVVGPRRRQTSSPPASSALMSLGQPLLFALPLFPRSPSNHRSVPC